MHLKLNTGSVSSPVERCVDWFCGSKSLALNHMQTFTWALRRVCNFSSRVCLFKQVTYVSRAHWGLNTPHSRRGLHISFDTRGYIGNVNLQIKLYFLLGYGRFDVWLTVASASINADRCSEKVWFSLELAPLGLSERFVPRDWTLETVLWPSGDWGD